MREYTVFLDIGTVEICVNANNPEEALENATIAFLEDHEMKSDIPKSIHDERVTIHETS